MGTGRNFARGVRILVSGACGFVGSTLIRALREAQSDLSIAGFDNFLRPGSQTNIPALKRLGVRLHHLDARAASDLETLAAADWVIDCAANPSVVAGVDGRASSRQLIEHNLVGSINLLEYCRQNRAGFILLSTSRVYAIAPLATLPIVLREHAFVPDNTKGLPSGMSEAGVSESFSTTPPVSLYGATKLASETLALEYGETFGFPVFINRCGVMAGAGQFGRPDQGIFSFWVHSWTHRRPLKYLGFDGAGHQVRDCLHPADLAPLILAQITTPQPPAERIVNVSGGAASARSLRQISAWCTAQLGPHEVGSDPSPRPFDLPWMVLDSSRAERVWNWRPARSTESVLEEIARQAHEMPDWLDLSAAL